MHQVAPRTHTFSLPGVLLSLTLPALPSLPACCSEDATPGTLLVIEYSLRPLNSQCVVELQDPSGNAVYRKEAAALTEDEAFRLAHTANRAGPYTLCFINTDQRQLTVNVQYKLGGREGGGDSRAPGGEIAKKETLKPMEAKLRQLEGDVQNILRDMQQSSSKAQKMQQTADSTSSRIMWFSGVTSVLLLTLKAAEILYLRRYFKSRRMIQ